METLQAYTPVAMLANVMVADVEDSVTPLSVADQLVPVVNPDSENVTVVAPGTEGEYLNWVVPKNTCPLTLELQVAFAVYVPATQFVPPAVKLSVKELPITGTESA